MVHLNTTQTPPTSRRIRYTTDSKQLSYKHCYYSDLNSRHHTASLSQCAPGKGTICLPPSADRGRHAHSQTHNPTLCSSWARLLLCMYVQYNGHFTVLFSGEFGVVYQATLNGWEGNYMENVAVKTLKGHTLSKLCSLTCNGDKEWQ